MSVAENRSDCMVDGDPASPVLIVGMAPGREELKHNKPFMGGSGQLLWKQLLKKASVSRADCYIINTIGEWPEGQDGDPTQAQFEMYWEEFDEAVMASKARVVFILGKAALWRFAGIKGIEEWRGYLLNHSDARPLERTFVRQAEYKTSRKCPDCAGLPAPRAACKTCRGSGFKYRKGDPKNEKFKTTTLPVWPESVEWAVASIHPAAVLRTGFASLPALAADAARVGRLIRGEVDTSEPFWFDGVLDFQYSSAPVVVDIETGGIGNDIITRVGASQNKRTWTSLWDGHSRDRLNEMFRAGNGTSAFNIGFDAPRLEVNGAPCPEPWRDVMLMAALAQPDLKKSLNFVSSLYLDKRRHKHLIQDQPAFYNAMDVVDTERLDDILTAELRRTGQLALFENRMMPTLPSLVRMTQRGIKVDQKRKEEWVSELESQRAVAFGVWEQVAPGMKTSGKKLLDWMYGSLGLEVQYSKYGGITSEVSGLKKLLLTHNLDDRQTLVLNTLIHLRQVEKELRTYAEVGLSADGCVHPGFLPGGKDADSFGKGIAGTGRITSSNPNIQNQPKSARRMYVPHEPGWTLLEADFSQIEARILAELADDPELKAAIAEGLHVSNMRVLGVDKTRAKNGFYGWAYGAGKRTLHNVFIGRGFNISEAECGRLLEGFDRRFARTTAWRRRITAELSTSYHLTNAFGRRRYFLGGGRDTPAGLDFHPQSCAADIMWTVIRPLEEELRRVDGRLLATVHDSILIECPVGATAEAAGVMRDVMEQPWPELNGLSIPVEVKRGNNWEEMEAL